MNGIDNGKVNYITKNVNFVLVFIRFMKVLNNFELFSVDDIKITTNY